MICKKEKCTGCFACYNICPKNAITMKEDEFGYIYPIIDKEKCIECKLCEKVCPSINKVKRHNIKTAFAMWSKDNNVREKSTSGGLATTLYQAILKKGGVAYGCTNNIEDNFPFIRIDNLKDLNKTQGSKYVHAYINETLKKVKKDLEKSKKVMFIGTPCQIAGLKNFLGKEYENLYTADIICHGVPSQKLLREEIENKIGKIGYDTKVTFRERGDYCIKVYSGETELLDEQQDKSFYLLAFMKSLFYRESCYNCQYANSNRIADITIGDFWGLGKNDKENKFKKEEKKGISVCLINTEKGEMLINDIKEICYFQEREKQEAILGNTQLRHPSAKNKEYDKFKRLYIKYDYKKASSKCLKKDKLKQKLKRILK